MSEKLKSSNIQLYLTGFMALFYGVSVFWDPLATRVALGVFALIVGAVILYVLLKDAEYDGKLEILEDGGGVRTFSLEVEGDPDDLAKKDVIRFKVAKTWAPEPPDA